MISLAPLYGRLDRARQSDSTILRILSGVRGLDSRHQVGRQCCRYAFPCAGYLGVRMCSTWQRRTLGNATTPE